MITNDQFKKGKIVFYSDFYDKRYCRIKLLEITKTRGHNFWFNAELIDNDHMDNKSYHKVGSIHSFSNSFIYKTLKDLKGDIERTKKAQINFLSALAI